MKMFKIIKKFYSKGTLIAFALLYAFLVTLGSTFSWVTSSEQKVNEFMGEMGIKAVIIEDFVQQNQWQPGSSVTKIVSVCNDGISPLFARISFEEIIKAMKAASMPEPYEDPEEEGVSPEFCMAGDWDAWDDALGVFDAVEFLEGGSSIPAPAGVVVKVKISPAGAQRNRYAIYQAMDALGPYRRMTALFSVSGTTLTVSNPRYWGYKSTDTYETELEAAWGLVKETSATAAAPAAANIGKLTGDAGKKISIDYANVINFPNTAAALTTVGADQGKWFYEGGFFYYIGRLEPGASTAALMTGLTLADNADFSYSNMELQFIVNLQALQLNAQALAEDWGLGTSSQLYAHLSSFCPTL